MKPKRLAAYATALLPLIGSLCAGVSVKVNISFNPPEERNERALRVLYALPEPVQNVIMNSDPWEEP